jgi:arylsulfatase
VITRFYRSFWTSCTVLLLALPGPAVEPANIPKTDQSPDILLIMPDQFRGDCLSIVGHPAVRTPHMDQIAREGALFRRAYSTCPSCIPARHSLLTGLYPSTSGVVGFAGRPITVPTLPELLSKAGYATMLIGRCMHQKPDTATYGYQKEVLGSTYAYDDDYDQFLKRVMPASGGIHGVTSKIGVTMNFWQAHPWPLAADLHPTAWAIDQARAALKAVPADKPVFLTASFFSPHPPLFPPTNLFNYYYTQKQPAPAHGDWVNWSALSTNGDRQGHRVLLQGDTLRATMAGYFGLIEQIDTLIPSLIEQFKARSRQAGRPWIVLLTSDHGEMLGDHGYFRKCEPYEGAANIPLLVMGSPELRFKAGMVSQSPVCLEDIMPTLLELARVPCPKPVDGISLVKSLRGSTEPIRAVLHLEHAPCYSQAQAFQALTDGRYKFIWRPLDGSEQLFDLHQDPREEHDLARNSADKALVSAWRQRMIKTLQSRPEGFTDGTKLIAGRPYKALQAANSSGSARN